MYTIPSVPSNNPNLDSLKEKLKFAQDHPHIFNERNVLNRGFVRLVDWLGNDERIVQAARVSYGKGTKTINEDAGLIDYLMRHRHTSPFEMVSFTFHIKLPLFVFAQLVRHRTASLNAMSARYSVMKDEFYVPEELRLQSMANKQSSDGYLGDRGAVSLVHDSCNAAYADYEYLLNLGVAREQARMILPQNLYTEVYWTQNLHNLLHLLKLRLDSHAQQEIREYAEAIHEIISPIIPLSLQSWEKHVLESVSLSPVEVAVLREVIAGSTLDDAMVSHQEQMSKGYTREVREKLTKLIGE
jgi:thymidylate synthase (FAD)